MPISRCLHRSPHSPLHLSPEADGDSEPHAAPQLEHAPYRALACRCYADGSSHTGLWRRGKKDGYGVMTYANGDVYDGEWAADRRHGSGTYAYADGSSFEGQWLEDDHMRGSTKRCGPTSRCPPRTLSPPPPSQLRAP